jgi:hypothetical protein
MSDEVTVPIVGPDGARLGEWRTTRRMWEETVRAAALAGESVEQYIYGAVRMRDLQHRLHAEGRQIDPKVKAQFEAGGAVEGKD